MTQKTYQHFLEWLSEARKCEAEENEKDEGIEEEVEIEEGQTIKTKTGIVHKGTYGSEYDTDEEGNEKKKEAPAVKRGRGRPKKGSDETGNVKKYTFHPALAKFGGSR